ncbi:Fur family transcriptional regulator [Pontibacter sp. G13]|uniref:Fur family transcriptional regulator n=1 Tax=Pontibacter sp. G13 TaxID=3074898 RepID=UPI00390585FF
MGIIRKTRSVQVVLEIFEQTQEAISGVDLVEGLRAEMNKTTVYRILQRLEDHSILHSFMGRDGRKWYAKCRKKIPNSPSKPHPHFQCRKCGKVECLHVEIDIPVLPKHKVDYAEFLLYGHCEECEPCS